MAYIQSASTTTSSVNLAAAVTIGSVIAVIQVTKDAATPGMSGAGWTQQASATAGMDSSDSSPDRIALYTSTATTTSPTFSRPVSAPSCRWIVYELGGGVTESSISLLSLGGQNGYTGSNPRDLGNFASVAVGDVCIKGFILSVSNGFEPEITQPAGWTEDLDDGYKGYNGAPSVGTFDHPWIHTAHGNGAGSDLDPAITNTHSSGYWGTSWEWAGIAARFSVPSPGTPDVDFVGTPLVGTAPFAVDFTDLSTNSPTSWEWDFGDDYTETTQNPTHIYQTAGIYTVGLTASNVSGSAYKVKVAYVVVYEPSIVDLTNTIAYNGYSYGFTFPAGGGPGQGSYIKRLDITEVEALGYDDKRALQDGKDAADVFLGERRIGIVAAVYGSTRGAAFDELAELAVAFHPVDAFEADETNLGFLPLDFFRPTADITTWPTSAYPSGIPLRVYARPMQPVRYQIIRNETGGVDAKGLALETTALLWARDPRFYLQTSQSVTISSSTSTLTYRGDYESWPIVSFTMTAAGNSACQIVIAGGSVKIDLSGTTTGSYQIDYSKRLITRTSDNTNFASLFNTSFTQDFRVVRNGSTAFISSTTGMSAITVDYREAFV